VRSPQFQHLRGVVGAQKVGTAEKYLGGAPWTIGQGLTIQKNWSFGV